MNPWIALIIGLLIGWLIELLIDVFYWRKRRLCPDDEALNLRTSLEQAQDNNRTLQLSLDENKNQLGQLETDLSLRDARINGLTADLDARKEEVEGLNGRIVTLTSNLDIYAGEIDGLNGRIHQLEADIVDRNNELEAIRTELSGIDIEAKELGFGSIFAGGGLALGSFWNNLRGRFSGLIADVASRDAKLGDMQAQFDTRGGELEGLKTHVGTLETNLADRNAEIGDLRVELDNKTVQLGKLETNLEAKNIEIGTRSAEINTTFIANDNEIAKLRLQVSDLEQKLSVCTASLVEMRSNLGAELKGSQGLSMVWGMNTTASDALANRGIYTYNQLVATQADEVNDAINLSRSYYPNMDKAAIHSSWVEHSRLAGSGDWDGLNAYQQERFDLVSLRDDLKKIWGIGPKVEQVFNDNGIYLFAQLASVPPDRITEILRRAGSRFSMSTGKLHDTWPEQARLADKDDWDGFKALHDTLNWSKVQGE